MLLTIEGMYTEGKVELKDREKFLASVRASSLHSE